MSEVLEKIKAQQTKRREEAERNYRALVAAVAAGNKIPSAEKIDEILNAARKDTEALEKDVKQVQRRDTLRETIARAEAAAERLPEIATAIDDEKRKLQEAEAQYRAAVRPLQMERDAIIQQRMEADNAQRELRELADDVCGDQLAELEGELIAATKERVSAERNLTRIQAEEPVKRHGFKEPTFQDREEWRGMVDRAAARLDAAREAEDSIVTRQNDLLTAAIRGN